MAKRKNFRVVCIPDVHVPYHDVAAWQLALRAVTYLKPDVVIQLGDFMDNLAVSSHGKEFGRPVDFDYELNQAQSAWTELERAADKCQLIMTLGNHETMLTRYIAKNAPAVESLIQGYSDLLDMSTRCAVFDYQKPVRIGCVQFLHDVGHAGKHAAQQTLEAVGHCVVFGHTHRATLTFGGTADGERRFAMNCGWLGDAQHIRYMAPAKTRDWQHAIGVVDFPEGVNGLAFPRLLPLVKGKVYAR